MANLTSNLTANLTDLGSLLGENEDQINKTNASDHTYRSASDYFVTPCNYLVTGTPPLSRLWQGRG